MPYARSSACLQLSGPVGIGKTRLVKELLAQLKQRQRSIWVLALDKQTLLEGGPTLVSALQVQGLKPDLERLAELFRQSARAGEGDLAQILIDLFESRSRSGWTPLTRLVFVLEDFAAWPEFKLREWRSAVRMLGADESNIIEHIDFVVTGHDAEDLSQAWQDYGLAEVSVVPLVLSPLTAPAAEALLHALGVPGPRHRPLVEQAQGMPATLLALAEKENAARAEASQLSLVEALFDDFPSRFHPLLHAGAALHQLARDGIEILLKRPLLGEEWKEFARLCREALQEAGVTSWGADFRQQILEYAQQVLKRPAFPDNLVRAINELTDILPDEMVRRQIVFFSPFFYFTSDLLKEVYPGQSAALEAMLKARPEAFIEVEGLYQLSPELQRPVLAYAELTGFDRDGQTRSRVQKLWKLRQEGLRKDIEQQEKDYQDLQQRLDSCSRELDRQLKSYQNLVEDENRLREAQIVKTVAPRPQRSGPTRLHRTIGGIAAEVLGIFFLYNGIIFTRDFNVVYCFIGLVLVMGGIMGNIGSPQPAFAQSAPVAPRAPVENRATENATPSHLRRLREYQVKTLQERKRSLQQRMQRMKKSLQETENRLQQAYVY